MHFGIKLEPSGCLLCLGAQRSWYLLLKHCSTHAKCLLSSASALRNKYAEERQSQQAVKKGIWEPIYASNQSIPCKWYGRSTVFVRGRRQEFSRSAQGGWTVNMELFRWRRSWQIGYFDVNGVASGFSRLNNMVLCGARGICDGKEKESVIRVMFWDKMWVSGKRGRPYFEHCFRQGKGKREVMRKGKRKYNAVCQKELHIQKKSTFLHFKMYH